MKIRKGDSVQVMHGKDKGKTGNVTQVLPAYDRVVVEGVNATTKHIKGRGEQAGQKISYNGPIHVSNVMLVSGKMVGRGGYEMVKKDGKLVKTRVIRKAKKQTDLA